MLFKELKEKSKKLLKKLTGFKYKGIRFMGIIFEDEIVENFKIEKADDLANLIVEYLCEEKYWKKKLGKSKEELLKEVLNSLEN
jgi:hypothetical protein